MEKNWQFLALNLGRNFKKMKTVLMRVEQSCIQEHHSDIQIKDTLGVHLASLKRVKEMELGNFTIFVFVSKFRILTTFKETCKRDFT